MSTLGEPRNNDARNLRLNAYLEFLKLQFKVVAPNKPFLFLDFDSWGEL